MSDIIESIISAPDSFSRFEYIESDGITRAWTIKFLGLDPENVDSHQQFEVVVSIFYHLIDVLFAKGCSGREICALGRLSAHYWLESLDRSLSDNVQKLQSAVEPLVPQLVSQRAAQIFLEYSVQTFLRHFHLYRACLTGPRKDHRLRRAVVLETPEPPGPLRDGRKPEEHQYHCQLREIDTDEQLARGGRAGRQIEEAAELAKLQDQLLDRVTTEENAREDRYPYSLVGDCIELNVRQMRLKVQDMSDSAAIDLIYKAKRTALPRPASMGPPPRFAAAGAAAGPGERGKSGASSGRSSAKSRAERKAKANK